MGNESIPQTSKCRGPGGPKGDGRLSRALKFACALEAKRLGLGDDRCAHEWSRLDPRDQARILHWLAWLKAKQERRTAAL